MKAIYLIPLALTAISQGATVFTFSSDATSITGDPLPAAVVAHNAYWETEDTNGDPLATPGFRAYDGIDGLVSTGNPSDDGFGAAISGNALNATNGPVLFTFASAMNLSNFGIVLDNSTMGNPLQTGVDPASTTNILFYDEADNLIGFLAVDQQIAGYTVSDSQTFENVSKIVLPGGAYYDNMTFTAQAVPEPTIASLAGLGLLTLFRRRR